MIIPDWPLPENICAFVTTREGGVSSDVYTSFNLATHVGDEEAKVAKNRCILARQLEQQYSHAPSLQWLNQRHTADCVVLDASVTSKPIEADACYTRESNTACTVLTADCLPILICADNGAEVAAVHAGWRGLANGIVQNTVSRFVSSPEQLSCYIGPAISKSCFQVGADVFEEFQATMGGQIGRGALLSAFEKDPEENGKYRADLILLARLVLTRLGIGRVYSGGFCSYGDKRFYSYRREGVTGRFATGIWIRQ